MKRCKGMKEGAKHVRTGVQTRMAAKLQPVNYNCNHYVVELWFMSKLIQQTEACALQKCSAICQIIHFFVGLL